MCRFKESSGLLAEAAGCQGKEYCHSLNKKDNQLERNNIR